MGKDRNTVAGEIQQALIKKLAKRLAYRFGSAAMEGAGLTARGFIEAFKNKKDYDELRAYLYGPESIGLEPFRGTTTGPSHDSMIGSRGAREYRDILNPEGEFVFPASVQPVLEQASDAGSNIYINADLMPYTGGYRYDAANHPVRITRDENGNLVGSAADIYDFDLGYLRRYDAPAWQVIPMASVGEPYIVRQDNIPLRFVGEDDTTEDLEKASKTMEAWGSAETPHRKKKRTDLPGAVGTYDDRDSETIAIENTLLRSGMPILEPATVRAEYPGFRQYGLGGWIKKLARDAKNAARSVASKEARLAESYSSKEYTFDEAYRDARSKGQKTFFWNGDYYNTDYEGEHGRQYKQDVASGKAAAFQAAYPGYINPELRKEKQEELDTYGITNEQTQNKSFLHERALKNLDFYGDYDWKQAVDALVLNHAQRAKSDTSPENLTHYQQLRFYLGYPLLEQNAGLARSGFNGYGAPVKISAFRPTTGTNSTPYYYTFLRNPYGNKGLTGGPARDKYERLKKASEDYLNGEFYKDAEKYGLDYAVQRADENTKRWDDYFDNHLDELVDLEKLENFIPATYRGKFETKDYGNASGLGNFTQYGTSEYRSFYDLWDIGLGQGNSTLTFGLGKPFEYYDRRYHDDETKQNIANPDIDSLYSNFDYSVGGPLLRRFGEGGPIHIKPSHRGRLTELKARTDKTEAELYNDGNPAHKKMVVFARSARKWRHADGGLLNRLAHGGLIERYGSEAVHKALQKMRGSHRYDGESEYTGQMNIAASQPWYNPDFDLGEYGGMIDPAVVTASRPVKQKKNKENEELARAIVERLNNEEAAKARAEGAPMMGEKPLESEDYLFGLAALGAKAPVIESMAAAKSFASAHPWLMRAIDVAGTADGVRNLVSNNGISKTVRLAKEGDVNGAILSSLGDLFDMIGGADAVRMISKLGNKSYRAYHAFNSFAPYSYDDVSKKGGAWLKSMLSEKKYSDVPPWRGGDSEAEFYNEVKDAFGEKTADFMKNAREDAWAIYLGREPRNGMYVKNADGTFSYNIDKLSDAYKDNPNFSEILKYAKEKKYDSVGVTHGGLWDASSANTGHVGEGLDRVTFGNFHMEDMWDLQPFQRHGDAIISARLNNKLTDKFGSQAIRDRAQAFREWMYDNGHWGDYGKKNSVFGTLLKPLDRPLNVYRGGWTRRLFKDTPDYVPEMFTIGDEFAPAGYHYEDVQIPRIADNIIDAITDNKITRFFDSRLKDFEAGRILGGTPFYMKTDIPYTSRVQINPDKVEAFNPENFQVITEFGRNVPNGYIDPGKLINFRFTDFHGGNIINSIDLSNITNGINRDGDLIERYGKDKVLQAIAKMKQSK